MILALYISSVAGWLAVGRAGARPVAKWRFETFRPAYYSYDSETQRKERIVQNAKLFLFFFTFLGPAALLAAWALADSGLRKAVPAYDATKRLEETRAQERALADLRDEINRGHKALGLPPLS